MLIKNGVKIPQAKNRTSTEKLKVDGGIKKAKYHVANFDSYNIDKQSLEAAASSWTDETCVVWKK